MLWILLAVMTVGAVAFLALPLLRRSGSSDGGARRAANVSAYRARMREIDADVSAGLITAAEAEAAKNDLASNWLADERGDDRGAVARKSPRRAWWALAIVVVAVPLAAGLVYWQQGSAELYLSRGASQKPPSLPQMIARIKTHLASQPDDVEGWTMLGRAYTLQRQYGNAAQAFAHANQLSGGRSAQLLVQQGQALALASHGQLRGKATQLFQRALKLDPTLPQALFYVGLAAYQSGDYQQAVKRWQVLYGQNLPERFKALIRPRLNDARQQIGLPPMRVKNLAAESSQNVKIPVRVTIARSVAAKLSGDDTVFIYARAHDGPKAPLAVVRSTVKELPQTVVLSDGMSVVPGLKLSSYKNWDVTARVSKSGKATGPQKGGYAAHAEVTSDELPETVHLNIAQPVE